MKTENLFFTVPYEDWINLATGKYDHQLYLKWKMGKEVGFNDKIYFYHQMENNLRWLRRWVFQLKSGVNEGLCLKFEDGVCELL